AASVFITPFRTCRGIHNGRIGSRVANISKTSNHAVGLCCDSISKFRNQRLEQSGYTLCSPESMYPCNHGLRGTNTKNQYDIDDLIDDFDLIKKWAASQTMRWPLDHSTKPLPIPCWIPLKSLTP